MIHTKTDPKTGEIKATGIYIHSLYDPPFHPGESNDEPSLTQQHYAVECDINNILDNYLQTGILAEKPTFEGDFSDGFDYRDALHRITDAQEKFLALPAQVRDRFGNDPGNLLDFLSDPKNRDEAVKLELVNAPEKIQGNVSEKIEEPKD